MSREQPPGGEEEDGATGAEDGGGESRGGGGGCYLALCGRPVHFEKANPVNCVFFDEANKQVGAAAGFPDALFIYFGPFFNIFFPPFSFLVWRLSPRPPLAVGLLWGFGRRHLPRRCGPGGIWEFILLIPCYRPPCCEGVPEFLSELRFSFPKPPYALTS